MIARLTTFLRTTFRRLTMEREMREEMEQHIERATERLMARGMSREDARAAARREFGNVGVIQEEGRDARGGRWIETTLGDLRYGARALRRSPVFTIAVVLSLALGIGANTAIFGVIYALMLERLPVPHAEQLVELRRTNATGDAGDAFWDAEYAALKDVPGVSFAGFTGAGARPIVIGNSEEPNPGGMYAVDGGFFAVLGMSPAAGRFLTRDDDAGGVPVMVLSHRMAVEHFGNPAAALGGIVRLRNASFTIVGVAPATFHGLELGGSFGMAMPLTAARQLLMSPDRLRRGLQLTVIGRTNSFDAAGAALDRAFQRCCANGELAPAVEGRIAAHGEHARLLDVSRGIPAPKMDLRTEYSRTLYLLMAGVGVLLLIACANVGNLLLARAASRTRELAVRLSLGASRWRVVRQLLVESLELACAGAALGLVLAVSGTQVLATHLPAGLVRLENVLALRPHPLLFAFTAAVAIVCAALFGIVPAIRATRLDPIAGLRASRSRSSTRPGGLDHGIVAVQVGLALVLVTSAGLLAATLRNLRHGDTGFESGNMIIGDTEVRDTRYAQTGLRPLYGEMLRRVRALPGVKAAGMATRVPVAYGGWSPEEVTVPGYQATSGEDMHMDVIMSTPGYLEATGIAVRRGRDFTEADRSGSLPVAIVTESFVRRFFGPRNPIGASIHRQPDFGASSDVTIVGVAGDAKYYDLRAPAQPTVYVPFEQAPDWGFLSLSVRTTSAPQALVPLVRSALNAAAPGVTVRWVQTMEQMLDMRLAREQTLSWLATMFAVLALAIATIGLYGVQSYQVAARSSEIGIRVALGAEWRSVVWLVLRRSLIMVAAGSVLGIPLAVAAGRAMGAQLYGVVPWQVTTLFTAVVVLTVVGLVASLVPASRAARVDPLQAIRVE